MKFYGYQVVIAVVVLIIFGALLITACKYTFDLLNQIEANTTSDQKYLAGWAKFGAVMIGIVGASSILRGVVATGNLFLNSGEFYEVDV